MASEQARPSGEVGALLRRLVTLHVSSERLDSVLQVATRLLESSLTTSPSVQTATSLSRAMLFRMVRDRKHTEASRLATLTAGLKFERGIDPDAVWPVLYVLNDLRGTSDQAPKESVANQPTQSDKERLPPTDEDSVSSPPSTEIVGESDDHAGNNLASSTAKAQVISSFSVDPFQPGAHPVTEQSFDDPVPDLQDNNDSDCSLGEPAQSSELNGVDSVQRPRLNVTSAPLQNKTLEKHLVRDLLLIVQGENGSIISFQSEKGEDSIRLNLPAGTHVLLPVHDMVFCVAETGFLFRLIRGRVEEEDTGDVGQVAQNMCRAIAREMDTYYRSLVTLRGSDNPTDIDDSGPERLTLRKVFVWAENEKPRLRWLARLCEETRALRGGQILAHLRHRRGSYISADIRDMISRILTSTAAPINRMLIRWLSEGVLVDPHQEFFILEDPKVAATMAPAPYSATPLSEEGGALRGLAGGPNAASSASHRIWWGLYKLQKSQLPGQVDLSLAQKALLVGKSIAFLRRCCSDSMWVDQRHAPLVWSMVSGQTKLLEADRKFDKDVVRDMIEATKASVCKRLKHLFFDKFDLSHHFGAIKRYLLLSQGDFTQALMDGLAPILDGDGNILRNNLTGFVDSALQSSSSFNEETDQDILERLDVQIVPQSGKAFGGWDVFSLTYRVEDAPLNTVFSGKVMDAYLLIFRFLWKLKRLDHLMTIAFLNLRNVEGQRKSSLFGKEIDEETSAKLNSLLKRLHFVRMKITHLVHNLQHYCTVEVLEGSWSVLEKQMEDAEDLDGMIHAHAKYLTAIKDRTLLSDRSKYVARELNSVLNTVVLFDTVQKEMCAWVETNTPFRGTGDRGVCETRIDELDMKLTSIESTFDQSFEKLLHVLRKHCRMVETCVFLLFRLDFNEYYARRAGRTGVAEEEPDEE